MRRSTTDGFTLIELLMVIAIVGVLAAIAAPFLVEAKVSGNEASAIGSMRAISGAEEVFSSTCGRGGYAMALADLVAGEYLSPDIVLRPKSTYVVALAPGLTSVPGPTDCAGNATETSFYASASPLSRTTGRRGFAVNPSGTVWEDTTGAVPVEPFAITGTVRPIQ